MGKENKQKNNFGKVSNKPIGNVSDNQIHLILDISTRTLFDWRVSGDTFRSGLYWSLKTMTKEELIAFKEKGEELRQDVENGVSVEVAR